MEVRAGGGAWFGPASILYRSAGLFYLFGVPAMEEKKRYCTIKERRAVARILAARDNEVRACDRHIQAVGNMSDAEILKFLDNEEKKAAAVEVLTQENVEEITPGGAAPDYYNLFGGLVSSYMAANNWDGEKISPLQWAACCMTVGRFVRSRSMFRVEQTNCITSNNMHQLDIKEITRAAGAYLQLCFEYNKTPLICDFCEFVAITKQAFYSFKEKSVTSGGIDLYKMIEDKQADGLRRVVIDGKRSPIGPMFLLKADHGLIEATKVQHEYIKTGENVAALPDFGSYAALTDENGEK